MVGLDEGGIHDELLKEEESDVNPLAAPRDSNEYPPPAPYLLYFIGGIFFCLTFQKLWPSTSPSCTAGGANAPVAGVPETTIAVLGGTGSGKSTFINLISGSNFGIGKGLWSFTDSVQATDPFYIDHRRVVLIDTPGFDDTSLSDTEVLNLTASFLADSYGQGKKLAGILYFHRISDFKMTGITRKNFNMFRKLCGDNALQNVVIVTNMWGEVDVEVGNRREAELMSDDAFFKPVLDKGARMARHENTTLTAAEIIRLILGNHPLPLLIQEELVEKNKTISETSAGEELNRVLNAQIEKHREEIRILKEDMEQAVKDQNEEVRRELQDEMNILSEKMEGLQNDKERLESDYKRWIANLTDTIRVSEEKNAKTQGELDRLSKIVRNPLSFLKYLIFG